MRWLLRKLGYLRVDYGFACGRHWMSIDGKVICQSGGDDFYMADHHVQELVRAVFPSAWQKSRYSDRGIEGAEAEVERLRELLDYALSLLREAECGILNAWDRAKEAEKGGGR